MARLNPYMKAVVAAGVAAVTSLLLIVTGNETFADITIAEWLIVLLAVLGSGGATYAVPNRPKATLS